MNATTFFVARIPSKDGKLVRDKYLNAATIESIEERGGMGGAKSIVYLGSGRSEFVVQTPAEFFATARQF